MNAVMQIPERSESQREDSLRLANEIRSRRAKLKKDIKAGRVDVRKLISTPPDYLVSMKVMDLLLALPKIGDTKAHRLLNTCRVGLSKKLGGLTARQRHELVVALG